MNRTAVTTAITAGVLAASLVGAGAASAAPAHTARLDAQDASFLKSNYQVDLTEIAVGHYIEHRLAPRSRAVALAERTVSDHEHAASLVYRIAKRDHVRLPTTPNADQKAAITSVEHAHHMAYQYFKVQVAGHELSIAQTKYEIKKGTNKVVVDYAKSYLPIAQMHLRMSEYDLARAVH